MHYESCSGGLILWQLLQNHTVTTCSEQAQSLDSRTSDTLQDTERGRGGGSSVGGRRTNRVVRVLKLSRRNRMRPRCFPSTVDRLPTISEQQESDIEDGDLDCCHTMEEYVDSIKELSQPAAYPLHGPLRGHRRWTPCRGAKPTAMAMFLSSTRSPAPCIAIDPSEVLITLTDHVATSVRVRQNLLDLLVSHSLFAGLV